MLLSSMALTAEAYSNGQLDSLWPFKSEGLIMTRGRLGEKILDPLLGVSKLPILMPSSRMAELVMWLFFLRM